MDDKTRKPTGKLLAAAVLIPLAIFAVMAISPSGRTSDGLDAIYERANEQLRLPQITEEPEGEKWTKEIR